MSPARLKLEITESAILENSVSLTEALSMDVTAEGIETAEQAACLEALDCEFGQGFYFCKPLAREDAHAALQARRWTFGVPRMS